MPRRRRGARPLARRRVDLLYLPALVVLAVFTAYPLLHGWSLSLLSWNGYSAERSFVGFDNFVRLFGDPVVAHAFGNTVLYGVGSTTLQQVLGLGLALALHRGLRRHRVASVLIYLPVLVSPVVIGMAYHLVFAYSTGAANDLLVAVGGPRTAWLSEGGLAVGIIVVVNSLQFVGISMVIYLAGLQSIPAMYRDAARIDGARGWQELRHIVLPLLRPAVAVSVVLNLIGGLKLFDLIRVLTNGGPGYATESLSTLIARTWFDSESAGYAAAQGVALFVLIALVTVAWQSMSRLRFRETR